MADLLVETLKELKKDPTVVVQLYKQLYDSNFYVITQKTSEQNIKNLNFLIYDTIDKVLELPVFTEEEVIINTFISEENQVLKFSGKEIWPRLYEIMQTTKCQVAVNPGKDYGIRLTKQMILGMITMHKAE